MTGDTIKKKIICISGIGADRRAFSKLAFGKTMPIVQAEWLTLTDKSETFDRYCDRMIETYEINSQDILIGLSFGGLVSQMIAKKLGNSTVVLISSFRNKNDLKPLMRLGLKFSLHRMLPSFRIPLLTDLVAFFLNSMEIESRKILRSMLKEADFEFIKWAIQQINLVNLKESFSKDYLSFTGTKDLLVSDWDSENHIHIKNGTHFMIYDKAPEINKVIDVFIGRNTGFANVIDPDVS